MVVPNCFKPPFLLLHRRESEIHAAMERINKREVESEESHGIVYLFHPLIPWCQMYNQFPELSIPPLFLSGIKDRLSTFHPKDSLPQDGPFPLTFISGKWPSFNRKEEE